ncbi:MAG: hypothetical protein V1824_04640 [archaeon]
MKNKMILIMLIIFSLCLINTFAVFADGINDITITADKENYYAQEDSTFKVNYTITNKGPTQMNLILYASFDEDELEVEDGFTKNININEYSENSGSFYIKVIDDGKTKLELYAKDKATGETSDSFTIDFDSDEDYDEGDFEIDLEKSTICVGETNVLSITAQTDKEGVYEFSLVNPLLAISQITSNPVYLDSDDTTIKYNINAPLNLAGTSQSLSLKISNEDTSVIKKLNVYLKDCLDPGFSVTQQYSSYGIKKGESKIITFTVVNQSNANKHIYVSDILADPKIAVEYYSNKEFDLKPKESKNVEIKFTAPKDIQAGSYKFKFQFLDYASVIERDVTINVASETLFSARFLQGSINGEVTFKLGQIAELDLVIENLGDTAQNFEIETSSDTLVVDMSKKEISVIARSSGIIPIYVSANNKTNLGINNLKIKITSKTNGQVETFNFKINAIEGNSFIPIEILAGTEQIRVDSNSTKQINLKVLNYSKEETVVISEIKITGLPKEITYSLQSNIVIPAGETKEISCTLNVGDITNQIIDASFNFKSNTGGNYKKKFVIIVGQIDSTSVQNTVETEKSKNRLTGFLTFGESFYTGFVLFCLIVLTLIAVNILKAEEANKSASDFYYNNYRLSRSTLKFK